ncbi:AAA family ATPase [Anabaena sphaerica FACHB-251]|uniref:AAA family ATPase n=1 Tax=Anabaena sphaerica FACHB-251 TaxID=2692883 RepID=A0A926ZZJ6_9NOST|nr:3'-5' exonuclease [Anabaena sphaerica]MBD2292684.1 AAA family ATPase [Anabaena sphaerica FACHB-251]
MALILPESISSNSSQGERNLFRILSNQLPDNFSVWYKHIIDGKKIDFIILAPNFGLLIIQVINYHPNQILDVNIDNKTIYFYKENQEYHNIQPSFYLDIPGRKTRKRSQQVKKIAEINQYSWWENQEFLQSLITKLQHYPILNIKDIHNNNKLAIPVAHSVVFSNITEEQGLNKNLHNILPKSQVIYRDELLLLNSNSINTVSRLKQIFTDTNQFDFPDITTEQIDTIKAILFPEIAIKLVPASSKSVPDGFPIPDRSYVFRTLDHRQESIVRSIGQGHRIIYGVAGSGKTLILLSHAKLLLKINPQQKILILCFNRSLSAYLNSLLAQDIDQQILGINIRVLTFYALVNSEVRKIPSQGGFSTDYYDAILGELLLQKFSQIRNYYKYDAILIDEAQTFHPSWFKCCVAALKDPNNGNLMIVADGGQSIYKRQNFTWKSVGVKAVGRTMSKKFNLDKNYRNTQEILTAAWSLFHNTQNIDVQQIHEQISDDETLVFDVVKPENAMRHGLSPVLHIEKSENHELESVISLIQELQQVNGLSLNDIAVIYRMADDGKTQLLTALIQRLTNLGIETYWISKTRESEKNYSINQSGIKILNSLSALGLEFKAVLILWVQDWEFNIPAISENDILVGKRLYVAMTRAQDILHIFGSGNSAVIQQLQNSGNFIVKN